MPFKLASLSKQNLLLEFSSLKHACPDGVFVTTTPGDPTLWFGVLFARKGPYRPSILRFQISFPPKFPEQAPLITFSSDIFHPLLTPLTTYTYTATTDTFSASDQDRLPPGGFSLRHGFPQWFGDVSRARSPTSPTLSDVTATISTQSITIYDLLEYLRKAFNEEEFLDALPLEAAANVGAYHAWHTHRARKLQSSRAVSPQSPGSSKRNSGIENISGTLSGDNDANNPRGRRPGQWNWEGVWEDRGRKGILSTISEQTLFGAASATEEMIRFSDLDAEATSLILQELRKREVAIHVDEAA